MSKENLERFMTQVADSEDLQGKIGEEITGDALVALGAAHGCEFSIEDLQAGAELSDAQLDAVAGGLSRNPKAYSMRVRVTSAKGTENYIVSGGGTVNVDNYWQCSRTPCVCGGCG